MANLADITAVTYEPSRQPEWFSQALFGGDFVSRGYARILPNIKNETLLNQIDWNGATLLQNDGGDCVWSPIEMVKLGEKSITPKTFKIQSEDCIERYESIWMVNKLKPGANDEEFPSDFTSAVLDIVAKEVNKEIETLLWAGDASVSGQIDGFVKLAVNQADSVKLTGSTLTVDNVIDSVESVFQAIPADVYDTYPVESIKAFVSYNTFRNLLVALTHTENIVYKQAFTISGETKETVIHYLGIEIVPVKGIGNDTIVATHTDNLIVATDLVSDFSNISLGQFPAPKENMIYVKGRLRLGASYVYDSEVVIFNPEV